MAIDLSAQYKSDATVGVRAGAGLSKVTEIPKMLVSEGYYSGYSFTDDFRPSIIANIFLSFKYRNRQLGLRGA